MDVIEDNTVVGDGINGTLIGAVLPVVEDKKGQAVRVYNASNQGHIYFGQHPDICLGNTQLCPALSMALWLKIEDKGWIGLFNNKGGMNLYVTKIGPGDRGIHIDLYCHPQSYHIKVYVPDVDPVGWNHFIISCSPNMANVFANSKEHFGNTGSTGLESNGKVTLGIENNNLRKPFVADELIFWYIPFNMNCASVLYNFYVI